MLQSGILFSNGFVTPHAEPSLEIPRLLAPARILTSASSSAVSFVVPAVTAFSAHRFSSFPFLRMNGTRVNLRTMQFCYGSHFIFQLGAAGSLGVGPPLGPDSYHWPATASVEPEYGFGVDPKTCCNLFAGFTHSSTPGGQSRSVQYFFMSPRFTRLFAPTVVWIACNSRSPP